MNVLCPRKEAFIPNSTFLYLLLASTRPVKRSISEFRETPVCLVYPKEPIKLEFGCQHWQTGYNPVDNLS